MRLVEPRMNTNGREWNVRGAWLLLDGRRKARDSRPEHWYLERVAGAGKRQVLCARC
jgi:hypothetical protein